MLRIDAFVRSNRENRDAVNRFLASRCDSDFLAKFMSRNPDFLGSLNVGSYFYAVSDIDIICRLHECSLLPEPERLRHVATVRELAVSTPDAGFLHKNIVSFITSGEIDEILAHVRATLLTDLDTCVDNWRDNHSSEEDPEEYFRHLKSALTDYEEALNGDSAAVSLIEMGVAKINQAVEELQSEAPQASDTDDFFQQRDFRDDTDGARSVFDDVDE
jgi:hypothetical protein